MPNMSNGSIPTEPAADLRSFASQMRQMFVALAAEGFTEAQALTVIGDLLRGSLGRG